LNRSSAKTVINSISGEITENYALGTKRTEKIAKALEKESDFFGALILSCDTGLGFGRVLGPCEWFHTSKNSQKKKNSSQNCVPSVFSLLDMIVLMCFDVF